MNNKTRKIARSDQSTKGGQEGLALTLVLFIMLILLFLGLGYLSWAFHETNLTIKEERNKQAFFLAKAGLQRTFYKLSQTSKWNTLDGDRYTNELGAGTYSVRIDTNNKDHATIYAEGTVGDDVRNIKVTVHK